METLRIITSEFKSKSMLDPLLSKVPHSKNPHMGRGINGKGTSCDPPVSASGQNVSPTPNRRGDVLFRRISSGGTTYQEHEIHKEPPH